VAPSGDCASHSVNYANHQHSPGGGTTLQTPFSPVSFGKSFMKIRSAVPENGCLVFCGGRKKREKTKKSVKHIRICLIGGCVNYKLMNLLCSIKQKKHSLNEHTSIRGNHNGIRALQNVTTSTTHHVVF